MNYVTIKEACERTTLNQNQIRSLKYRNRIRHKKENGRILVYIDDVIQYNLAHFQKEKDTVWDEIDYIKGEVFYPLFGYDNKYFVSNMQRVINTTNGKVLIHQPTKDNLYKYVRLFKNGKEKNEYLHRLIARTQCPNALFKNEVHHITMKTPSIDKANNLLWVDRIEHVELHELLKENKMEEYREMIKRIKKENSQKLYKIPHPDFPSSDKHHYYLWLDAEGYKAYKKILMY